MLVFVADEEDLAEVTLFVRFHLWDAIEDGPLKIQFHHHAKSAGETGVHANRKIEGTDFASLNKPSERRQWLPVSVIGIGYLVIAPRRWAECPLHVGVVIEQRKKDGDALHNRSAELRLDAFLVMMKPTLHGFQLLPLAKVSITG